MSSHRASRSAARFPAGPAVSTPVLAALVGVDLALVAVSVVRLVVAGPGVTDPWLLETDGGWAERFGYLQQAAIAALLVGLAFVARRWIFVAFATVYACALADDSLRLHENKGAWLVDMLDRKLWFPDGLFGLRAYDLGEILVWGLLSVVPLAAIVLLYLRADAATRRTSRILGVLLGVYVFFGGVVDQLHVLLRSTPIGDAVGSMEDGGELVALSATVAYAVALLASARRDPRTWPAEEPAPARDAVAPPAPAT